MTTGYLDSPWPGEDGGPQHLRVPRSSPGLVLLNIETGAELARIYIQ